MDGYLSQIVSRGNLIPDLWRDLHGNISEIRSQNDNTIDLTLQIPGCLGSVNQIGLRLVSVYSLVGGLKNLPVEDALVFPQQSLISLLNTTNIIIQAFERVSPIISPSAPNPIQFLDGNPWKIQNQNGTLLLELDAELTAIDRQVESASEIVSRLLPVLNLNKNINLSEAIRLIAKSIHDLNDLMSGAHEVMRDAEIQTVETLGSIDAAFQTIKALGASADELVRSSTASDQITRENEQNSRNILSKIEENLSKTETVINQASELRGSVTTFQSNFDEFQKRLSEREKLFETGNTQINNLSAAMEASLLRLRELRDEAEIVVSSAKGALGWGSEAGLARSFSEAAEEQDKKLRWAERGFYLSIAFMLLLVSVAIGIFPAIELPRFISSATESPLTAFIVLLAAGAVRVLIILPAWLALSFTNARYKSLMRMKEAYLFKKTIAAALPGFKETAAGEDTPEHAKTITVSAFEQLLFNPQESEVQKDELDWLRKTPREVVIEALKTVREAMKLGTSGAKPEQ